MEKLIFFKNLIIEKTEKKGNIPRASKKETEKFRDNFLKKGWYDGELLAALSYGKKDNILKLNCGKSSFFDFLASSSLKSKICPIIAVNSVIKSGSNLLLIKRNLSVSSYPSFWDFPAGMVPFHEPLEERLFNRIKNDSNIEKEDLQFLNILPCACILDGQTFNFFYEFNHLHPEKINPRNDLIIADKSEILSLIKEKRIVYPKILEIIQKSL